MSVIGWLQKIFGFRSKYNHNLNDPDLCCCKKTYITETNSEHPLDLETDGNNRTTLFLYLLMLRRKKYLILLLIYYLMSTE